MKNRPSFWKALIPLLGLIITALCSIFLWDAGMIVPLIVGVILAAIVAISCGWSWMEVQQMMVNGVSRVLPAIFILLTIGVVIGSWIANGTIPTMIYYGMLIIDPAWFLPVVPLVTGIISVTLGTSFTSIATVGIAFMAIGDGLGFSPAIVAGAVITGAFFGDKLSPLSDTTNIAAAVVEIDLFTHVRHMLWDTIPAFVLSIMIYWIIGYSEITSAGFDEEAMNIMMTGLKEAFVIHPLLLLLPIFVIVLILRNVAALPALIVISVAGAVLAVIVQGTSVGAIVQFLTDGFAIDTGVEAIDSLLNRGGLTSMLGTIVILTIATAFGGILEETGAFEALTRKMMEKVKTTASLISSTILSTLVVALASGEQYLSNILPGRTFIKKYKNMNIDTKNLSRATESIGTVGINLIPWSVPAVFAASIFELHPWEYLPYAFFVFLVPIINLLFGFTGWTIVRKDYS
ncbi:Na+/H+ antiporter NhaC [Aliibacillus thermotolerans]|uniref:Na+/H+ antiporter NhaC n=1 Tax=Aliibacillus thermotolerans TaxID=1834418 RepID=A0ABW0U6S3_9BACI|nr:Na+/H+ antiporter NhaC [Aliibacillus thermotolerans]MDA3130269.1 Na+/H+ antiporter NhaC [Aliibacillus thermotolerans]